MREQWEEGEHGETGKTMCQTQAVSFATKRIGWLHRKTEREKLFSTPANFTSLCWSFCFAFLCFFSPCFPSSQFFHAAVNLRKQIFCQVSQRVLTFITQVKYKRAGPVRQGFGIMYPARDINSAWIRLVSTLPSYYICTISQAALRNMMSEQNCV